MSDKPTPETDAELERSLRACHSYACGPDFARKLERERGDARSERDNLNRVVAMIAAERDDYKNHFEACEAQRQRQLVELERLRKDLCEIAEGCHVGHPDIEESKRRIIAIREERDELRAEVERLSHEIREMTARNGATYNRNAEANKKNASLLAEVERLRKDLCEKEFASVQELSGEVERLKAENRLLVETGLVLHKDLDALKADGKRLDKLEEHAQKSRTGISFDWCRHVEEGQVSEHGFRFMRHHFLGERKPTLREAIDAAMKGELK